MTARFAWAATCVSLACCTANAQPALPDMEATCARVRERVAPVTARGEVPVLGGFIGATVAGVTTTNGVGDFAFNGVSAGTYIVKLVSNGYVLGTSAPIMLAPKNMTVEGVTAIANPPAAQAQAGALSGSFWSSTAGIITAVAIAAAVVTVIVVAASGSPSR